MASSKAYGGLENETQTFKTLVAVHGALMALSFVILFPLGATLLRLLKRHTVVRFHGVWQLVALIVALVGFGIGIYMVRHSRSEVSLWRSFNGHPILGVLLVALLLLQPLSGAIHHTLFKKRSASATKTTPGTPLGVAHRWLGRLLLVLAAINGGLGFQLAKESSVPIIIYGVVCLIFFALWGLALWRMYRSRGRRPQGGDG